MKRIVGISIARAFLSESYIFRVMICRVGFSVGLIRICLKILLTRTNASQAFEIKVL